MFNDQLMGIPGGKQVEVDARGHHIRVLSEKEPLIGKDVHLTLDVGLQERVLAMVDEWKSMAVCILDVHTGEILSLVSTPTFNPNIFLDSSQTEKRMEALKDERNPIVNRTISLLYSPGSVFKVLIGLAALEEGVINGNTVFYCNGEYRLNERSRAFHCWKTGGHGTMDLVHAIEQSCNVYFYRVGLMLGSEKIAKYARLFGFGQEVQLGLPYGKPGLVPDSLWKLKMFRERWYPGETLNYAIGQGFLQVNPLQIARMVAIIANGGKWVEPNLIQGAKHPKNSLPIRERNFSLMRRCMLEAIESDFGTGQLARPTFHKMAGKTGTAQTVGEPHSWYAGFFPYHDPQIALVVLVEHGGAGGGEAAVYAGRIADAWLLYTEQSRRKEPMELV